MKLNKGKLSTRLRKISSRVKKVFVLLTVRIPFNTLSGNREEQEQVPPTKFIPVTKKSQLLSGGMTTKIMSLTEGAGI